MSKLDELDAKYARELRDAAREAERPAREAAARAILEAKLESKVRRDKARAARDAAHARREPVFDSGFPCKRGHNSVRYTCNGGCLECLGIAIPKIDDHVQDRIAIEWIVRKGLTAPIGAPLLNYLTECFVTYFDHHGDKNVLERHKLEAMRATGKPYGVDVG